MSDRCNINHAYQILGLKPDASQAEVKQAYRELAKTWHPDRFLEPQQKQEAEEKIKTINDAYEKLKFYHPSSTNQSSQTNKTNIYAPVTPVTKVIQVGLLVLPSAPTGKFSQVAVMTGLSNCGI